MRITACALLALAACHPGSDDSFPIVPQGDDTSVLPAPDAPADASGDAAAGVITGRVCVVTDLRNLTSGCAATGVAGIAVRNGTETTTTADDGSFSVTIPSGETPAPVWTASGTNVVTSNVKFGAPNLIPMTTQARYNELLNVNGMTLASGEGSIIARVVRAGAALPGATATSAPPARYVTHYDAATANLWEQDSTGTTGVLWIPAVPAGSVSVTLAPGTLAAIAVPVADQAITFATFDVP